MDLAFPEFGASVRFEGTESLIGELARLTYGWHRETAPVAAGSSADICVARTNGGFRIATPELWPEPEEYDNICDILAAFLADLIALGLARRTDWQTLHATGVEYGGGLLVFPARGRSGKTTLAVYFAACGWRVFADDVLPLVEGGRRGFGIGVMPRVRLPLAPASAPGARQWIDRRLGLANEACAYLALSGDELAPFGTTAPVVAVLVPARRKNASPVLEPLSRSEALRHLLREKMTSPAPAVQTLEIFGHLVETVPCYRLVYEDASMVPAMLRESLPVAIS